ncbi:MAG TPA: hypothetical protein VF681_09610 [Abditibacteriaceae bacterium]|jgi:hypothetical protein
MNAAQKIIAALEVAFASYDAEAVEKDIDWAMGRVAAIKALQDSWSRENNGGKRVQWNYAQLFAVAGGKTWYNVFQGRNGAMIEEFMRKNAAARIERRNASIAKKIGEVEGEVTGEIVYTRDGFDGIYKVGGKAVYINTIRAGGYNIQCAHYRVLVKVRDLIAK